MRAPCPAVAEHRAGEPAGLVALQPDDFGSGVQFDIGSAAIRSMR